MDTTIFFHVSASTKHIGPPTPVKQEPQSPEREWTVGIRASCPRPTSRSASALAGKVRHEHLRRLMRDHEVHTGLDCDRLRRHPTAPEDRDLFA